MDSCLVSTETKRKSQLLKSASVDGRNKWHWNVCFSWHYVVDHCRKSFV